MLINLNSIFFYKQIFLTCFFIFVFYPLLSQIQELNQSQNTSIASPPCVSRNFDINSSVCLSNSERINIKEILKKNCRIYNLNSNPNKAIQQKLSFIFPLKLKTGLTEYGYYSISAYVDHDPAYPQKITDYNCGKRTYDTDKGYNHQGTDFFLWPFGWNKMYSNDVEVVATADGTILYKQDGFIDRNCELSEINKWNAVYIRHDDGSETWYGHLKSGSITTKGINERVSAGEYLGLIGSSGNSTAPHLHFEVYGSDTKLIDPFQGSCNLRNQDSWWAQQIPYNESGINKISTHSKLPFFSPCPQPDSINESTGFSFSDSIYFFLFYRNLLLGDLVSCTIYRPDNSVWYSWIWNSNLPETPASYSYWKIKINDNEQEGIWKFETNYKGKTYSKLFKLEKINFINEITFENNIRIYPIPAHNLINIEIDPFESSFLTISIIDALGKLITWKSFNPVSGNFKTDLFLPVSVKGFYLIRIETNSKVYYKKLLFE